MAYDLQKASMWKRISAYLFDMILIGILAVGIAALLSFILGYDKYYGMLESTREKYETEYSIELDISEAEYNALSEQEKVIFNEANNAFSYDTDAVYAYNMIVNLTLLILTFSILLAYAGLELLVPILFGNGQTLGKKIFGIALMKIDGIKINNVSLFVRTILGKYTIETMIPTLIIIMIFFGSIGIVGVVVIGLIFLLQLIMLIATHTNSAIHDVLSNTVVVDYASQRIFDSEEAMIEYKKRLHAEDVSRSKY